MANTKFDVMEVEPILDTSAEVASSEAEVNSEESWLHNITDPYEQDDSAEQLHVSSTKALTTNGAKTPTTPTRFPDFQKLPTEIRVLIWKMAAHLPRVLEVDSHGEEREEDYQSGIRRDFGLERIKYFGTTLKFSSPVPVPAPLHVNYEARNACLKFYKPRFGLNNFEPHIYFHEVSDTILLPKDIARELCHRELPDNAVANEIKKAFKKVLKLALVMVFGVEAWEKDPDGLRRLLSVFPNIESFTFIHRNGEYSDRLTSERLHKIDEKDILRRYQEKVLVKAVQKCYEPNANHPKVELVALDLLGSY